jgi:hypothetical protein
MNYLLKTLGVAPIVAVLIMWLQGYVDEFYQTNNNAPWIDDFFRNHEAFIQSYWLITASAITYGIYSYLRGVDKSIRFSLVFAILAILLAFVFYFVLIKDIPKAGP